MKTLVLGASTNPERYAYKAIEKLTAHKYELLALGFRPGEVLGHTIETEKQPWEGYRYRYAVSWASPSRSLF